MNLPRNMQDILRNLRSFTEGIKQDIIKSRDTEYSGKGATHIIKMPIKNQSKFLKDFFM